MLAVAATEPESLRAIADTPTTRFNPEKYGSDVVYTAHGMFGGVQRKEFTDLIASVESSDRLTREIIDMGALEWRLLIIEGQPNYSTDGVWLRQYGTQGWTKAAVRGLVWSIMAKDVNVMWTDDLADTIETVQQYVAWCRKDQHNSLNRRVGPTSPFGTVTKRDRDVHFVQSLAHVGPVLAATMVDAYGLPFRWGITREDLLALPKVGEKKADAIWNQLPSE